MMRQGLHTRDALSKFFHALEHGHHINQVRLVQIEAPSKRRPIPRRLYVLGYAVALVLLLGMVLP